jgi:hypothetical protein
MSYACYPSYLRLLLVSYWFLLCVACFIAPSTRARSKLVFLARTCGIVVSLILCVMLVKQKLLTQGNVRDFASMMTGSGCCQLMLLTDGASQTIQNDY